MQTFSDFCLQDSLQIEKELELVSMPCFSLLFKQNCSLGMLHKLAKFNYHTVFILQVLPPDVFYVLC